MARATPARFAVRGFAAIISFALATGAHLQLPTVRGERTVDLALNEDPIRLRYRLGLGAELAAKERQSADRDGDGRVSAVEGTAALDARTEALLDAIRVCAGLDLAHLSCTTLARRDVEALEVEGWTPDPTGHLLFAWTLTLRQRASEIGALRLEDSYEVPGIELSEFRFARPAHGSLTLAGEADHASGVAASVTFVEARREPGPRVVVAQWQPPAPRPLGIVAAIAALAATCALVVTLWTRRRGSV
jgi:hypothetical protein